jgi:hypothetical protein
MIVRNLMRPSFRDVFTGVIHRPGPVLYALDVNDERATRSDLPRFPEIGFEHVRANCDNMQMDMPEPRTASPFNLCNACTASDGPPPQFAITQPGERLAQVVDAIVQHGFSRFKGERHEQRLRIADQGSQLPSNMETP